MLEMKKALLVAILAAVNAACVTRADVKRGFYKAPPPEKSTGLTAALFMPPDVGPATRFPLPDVNPKSGAGTKFFMKIAVPDFELAVSSALSAVFEVRRVADAESGRSADFLVTLAPGYMGTLGLKFLDPETGTELARFEKPAFSEGYFGVQYAMWSVLGWNPMWWLMSGLFGPLEARDARNTAAKRLAKALDDIVAEVRGSSELLRYPQTESRARALVSKAEAAERAGHLQEAFERFSSAREIAYRGGGADAKAKAGVVRVAARMNPKPAIPARAREHMVRGEVIVGEGGKLETLREAAGEFEKALDLAPWWPEARFNFGLVLGELGRYDDAIGQLKLYLESGPRDAEDVETKIVEFKVRKERASK